MRKFEIVKEKYRKFPDKKIRLPQRADNGSCGYDFFSLETVVLYPGQQHLFFTDVKAKMNLRDRLEINTRSGNGVKYGLVLANTIGFIDASYYNNPGNDGNIGICLKNTGTDTVTINEGDRIAQGCFSRYLITLDDRFKIKRKDNQRKGGFGSTGIK